MREQKRQKSDKIERGCEELPKKIREKRLKLDVRGLGIKV